MPLSHPSVKTLSATVIVVAAIYALTNWGKQATALVAVRENQTEPFEQWEFQRYVYLGVLIIALLVWLRSLRHLL